MQIIIHKCDGCKNEILTPDLANSINHSRAYMELHPGQASAIQEIFCENCSHSSTDFWNGKIALLQQITREFDGRLRKYKTNFWMPRLQRKEIKKVPSEAQRTA